MLKRESLKNMSFGDMAITRKLKKICVIGRLNSNPDIIVVLHKNTFIEMSANSIVCILKKWEDNHGKIV